MSHKRRTRPSFLGSTSVHPRKRGRSVQNGSAWMISILNRWSVSNEYRTHSRDTKSGFQKSISPKLQIKIGEVYFRVRFTSLYNNYIQTTINPENLFQIQYVANQAKIRPNGTTSSGDWVSRKSSVRSLETSSGFSVYWRPSPRRGIFPKLGLQERKHFARGKKYI